MKHLPLALLALPLANLAAATQQPNIILVMADDQGYGDTGYNGHKVVKTPALDRMAREGIRFDRFYASSPVCSPTRASVLTGRHPVRMGIEGANSGHLPEEEFTLAELCKQAGYTTGHFGKWHLGTLTRDLIDSNRGGRPKNRQHFSPPWLHGFDVCFSTEAKVPTWDPMLHPETGEPYGTRYFDGTGAVVTENLTGDDCQIIMDRALPFMGEAARNKKPFLAVIWLHAPHRPVVAGAKAVAPYANETRENLRDYYAIISSVDSSVGRLRSYLEELKITDNTMLWFTSDNGPEGSAAKGEGSAGGLRGRKRSLYEGGVRVPGLLVWPDQIPSPRRLTAPVSTMDYLPTIAAFLGRELPKNRPLDGVDLGPLLRVGAQDARPTNAAIPFQAGNAWALHKGNLKAIRPKKAWDWELYDLAADPGEKRDLAREKKGVLDALVQEFALWQENVAAERDS